MDGEKTKIQIGNNIAAFRRQLGLTQAELAEKINYSDKAVSKWERGDSVPDVMTLVQLAELFGVTVNDLVGSGTGNAVVSKEPERPKRRVNKLVIQLLASLLVWFVALFLYVVLSSVGIPRSWMGFLYAIPANAIVLLALRSAWRKYRLNFLLISLIVWGTLVGFYATMLIFTGYNIWKLFLLGILGQAAICLWFRMFRDPKEEDHG